MDNPILERYTQEVCNVGKMLGVFLFPTHEILLLHHRSKEHVKKWLDNFKSDVIYNQKKEYGDELIDLKIVTHS